MAWTRQAISQLVVPNTVTKSNIADTESNIIEMPVPRGLVWNLRADRRLKVFLYTKDTFTGTGAQTVFNLTQDLVDSPNLPAIVGDTVVYVNAVLQTSGYTVDYAANTITFASAPAAVPIVVYYLFVPALVKVKVVSSTKEREKTIHTGNIVSFHTNNQYAEQTAVTLGNSWVLDEKYYLVVAIKSSAIIYWDAAINDYQLFELEAMVARKAELDQADLGVVNQFRGAL